MGNMLRSIGLWMLIGFDIALLTTLALCQQWFWVFFFATVTTTVGIFEGLSYCTLGKTISQQYYQFRKDKPFLSFLALIFFALSMAGLFIHLL